MTGDAERARARRVFIRDNHPDRGGDPERFIAGLLGFESRSRSVVVTGRPRLTRGARARLVVNLLLRRKSPPRVH